MTDLRKVAADIDALSRAALTPWPELKDDSVEMDNCDDCGREMPLTGDSLCRICHKDDERRRICIVCGGPKIFLDDETCSDRCDRELEKWPEP